jgi:hypothetical protein
MIDFLSYYHIRRKLCLALFFFFASPCASLLRCAPHAKMHSFCSGGRAKGRSDALAPRSAEERRKMHSFCSGGSSFACGPVRCFLRTACEEAAKKEEKQKAKERRCKAFARSRFGASAEPSALRFFFASLASLRERSERRSEERAKKRAKEEEERSSWR